MSEQLRHLADAIAWAIAAVIACCLIRPINRVLRLLCIRNCGECRGRTCVFFDEG